MNEDILGQAARERLGETARQCTATNHSGERCRRAPIVGGFVCHFHGGNIPAVQRSARDRLLRLVDPVLEAFNEILEHWHGTKCETCGRPTGDPMPIIRLGQIVLDRSGHHPTLNVQTSTPTASFAGMSLQQIADRAEQIAVAARRAADAEQKLLTGSTDIATVDGVVMDGHPDSAVARPLGD